jgi:annexin A7/11
MCCWCSCLECIHNIPPLNLLFPHFDSTSAPGHEEEEEAEAAPVVSMASISVPDPVPSPTEDAENIRKAVQGIIIFQVCALLLKIFVCLFVS